MSLFEDSSYRWRETYFVLFNDRNRPPVAAFEESLRSLGDRFEVKEVRTDDEGNFESATLLSPYDFAAMDITFMAGEDVSLQVEEMLAELKRMPMSAEEKQKLQRLTSCDARYEVYHFEQVSPDEEDDECLDPGGLLLVLQKIAGLVDGVSIDPQSGTLMT